MDKKYFIVNASAEGSLDVGVSMKLKTHDEMKVDYLDSLIDYMIGESIEDMSDEELKEMIEKWKDSLQYSDFGFMTHTTVYQVDLETFRISEYNLPIQEMIDYLRNHSDEF